MRLTLATLVGLACLASQAVAFYSGKSGVVEVTDSNFAKTVLKNDGVVMLEFYAPWCGHCKNLKPEWEKAAKALKGLVTIAAVDATQHQSLASRFQVQGFPTIKVFGSNKNAPTDYQGGRTAKDIVGAAMREANSLARSRLGGKAGSKGKKKGGGSQRRRASEPGGGKQVVELTEDNFDNLVTNSGEPWMVEFYAPWCGHCKSLAPEWAKAAEELDGDVQVGAVDATQHQALAQRYGVQGYPTIKVFPAEGKPYDYRGQREAGDIVAAALQELEKGGGATAPLTELTSQKVFESLCKAKKICVVAFLPHLLDEDAAARRGRLAMLESVAKKNRRSPFKFLWTSAGQQAGLETALGIDPTSMPTVVAISRDKGAAALHRGAFDEEAVGRFCTGITTGSTRPQRIRGAKLTAVTVPEWDGQDAAPPSEDEEEFSLEDIMGEDL